MRKRREEVIAGHRLEPESLSMGYGYRPEWSEGSIKSPIFQTSTFVFQTAEEGKHFFQIATGQIEAEEGESPGMIYSRLNNPDLEILEDRLCLWEDADMGLVFASGMAAIATTLLTYLRPGDILLHSEPLYGGSTHLVNETLPEFGIISVPFRADMSREEIEACLAPHEPDGRLAMILIETPANPTLDLIDIRMCADIAAAGATDGHRPLLAVDNTFLGPLWQHPLQHGADLVLYSATKYIGGHSDLVAGAVIGSEAHVRPIAATRTYMGTMADPWTGWLLMRSLETLHMRMTRQGATAAKVARFLEEHPKVRALRYLDLLDSSHPQYDVYRRQCLGPGAMISFEVDGGELAAFKFLNALKLVKLAVSLGGTESLAEHPASMTHSGVPLEEKERTGVTAGLVRLSVGVEHPDDLIADLSQALGAV
ncbi:MAG TPA: cystathionine gamma-synthase family protein [Acidimicrobiia bacterium]|jgi:methionine-gamma-lyase